MRHWFEFRTKRMNGRTAQDMGMCAESTECRKRKKTRLPGIVAGATAAVALAVTGVLPGEGLQEAVTVEAAEDEESQPKKGTMEFWEWNRVMRTEYDEDGPVRRTTRDGDYDEYDATRVVFSIEEILPDPQWDQRYTILPIYQKDGSYYVPTGGN